MQKLLFKYRDDLGVTNSIINEVTDINSSWDLLSSLILSSISNLEISSSLNSLDSSEINMEYLLSLKILLSPYGIEFFYLVSSESFTDEDIVVVSTNDNVTYLVKYVIYDEPVDSDELTNYEKINEILDLSGVFASPIDYTTVDSTLSRASNMTSIQGNHFFWGLDVVTAILDHTNYKIIVV